jgi:hypothetical protein
VSDVYAIVRSIREKRFSRNRYFDEHKTEASVEARRVHRFLRAVERDVLAAHDVRVQPKPPGYQISLGFPDVKLTRVVSLTEEEYGLLVEEPRVAAKLRALLGG